MKLLLTLILSFCLGWGLAQMIGNPAIAQSPPAPIGTVDPVPDRYQLGQDMYLESCATCHIALPPAVLPIQTWQTLLQDSEHYGTTIDPPKNPNRKLIWNYLSTFSRPLRDDEPTPFRLSQARHFQALHPQVKLPTEVTIATCATCHPKADVFNFRELAGGES
jgi:Dihaem cytochrome c